MQGSLYQRKKGGRQRESKEGNKEVKKEWQAGRQATKKEVLMEKQNIHGRKKEKLKKKETRKESKGRQQGGREKKGRKKVERKEERTDEK